MAGIDGSAMNTTTGPVVEYLPDPRGWGLFAALAGRHQHNNAGQDTPTVIGAPSFGGWAASSQQSFRGLAGLGAGSQRPMTPKVSELHEERGAADPAMNIFHQRMARGQR